MSESQVKVIADSTYPNGIRITTLELSYWRAIHSEFMTHRMFSRNASSSRAIPVEKLIKQVREIPSGPLYWGSNKPGMQAGEELTETSLLDAKAIWLEAANKAANCAEAMASIGLHKQVANRVLEPFVDIKVVVTATEWNNFFALRDHSAAMPEIQDLAKKMKVAMDESTPNILNGGCWHLPYVRENELLNLGLDAAIKTSVARCARVSYLTYEHKETTLKEDLDLYNRLVAAAPPHMSPAEHQATPREQYLYFANFRGWESYRYMLETGK